MNRRHLLAPTLLLAVCGQAGSSGQAPTLKSAAQPHQMLIGGAVTGSLFDDIEPEYAETVAREFSVIVMENGMKWKALENDENNFVYGLADATVKWAREKGLKVRGHTLVWHDSAPGFVYNIKEPQRMRDVIKNHVQTVVKHFGDQVPIWDVVNEAISDAPGHPLRGNNPFALAGPDFIEMAFRWAHEANPGAKLFYNDYNVEGVNGKSDAMYALVKGLLARGVPIHGVGFQTHVDSNFSVQGSRMKENLKRFADLGLEVQLTEVDVQIRGEGNVQEKFARQAEVYRDLMNACLSVKCTAFTTWGVHDPSSWRAAFRPLLFDDQYAKKPAYGAVIGALQATRP